MTARSTNQHPSGARTILFSPANPKPLRRTGLIASAAAHGAIFLVVVGITLHLSRVRPIYRESRCCTAALYWTGNSGISAASPKAARKHRSKPAPALEPKSSRIENPERPQRPPTAQQPSPAAQNHLSQAGAPSQQQQQQTLGTGTGDDDAEPAFPTYYPRPAVADRSLLPAAEKKIIVNVSISAVGDVTDEQLVQGLGNNLDQIVLATVKSWRFHPASLNGTAVASVEQLVFPFNRQFGLDDGGSGPT